MELIITYLLTKGGVWGVLFAVSLAWIAWREKLIFEGGKKEKTSVVTDDTDKVIKKIFESNEEIKSALNIFKSDSKVSIDDVKRQIDEIKQHVAKIENLYIQINDLNENRIYDLKEIINDYNKNTNELTLALERIKISIEKLEE